MHKLVIDENQVEKIYGMTAEYPYTMHINSGRDLVPWHWHEEFELLRIASGSVRIQTENTEQVLQKDEVAFTNSNVLETITPDSEDTVTEAHLFHPSFLGGHFQSIFETRYLRPVMNNRQIEVLVFTEKTPRGKLICRKVRELSLLQQEKHVEFQTRNMLSDIWLLILEEVREYLEKRSENSIPGHERIRYMLTFIHMHYSEKVTLDDIARSANISEREALRTFRKMINQSPMDYLTEYRISKACDLLKDTKRSITDIALSTGFSDSAYFGRMFRKYHQATPGEYRRKHADD